MCTDPYLQGDETVTRSRSQTPMSRKRKRAASSGARSLSRPLRDQSGIGSPEVKKQNNSGIIRKHCEIAFFLMDARTFI